MLQILQGQPDHLAIAILSSTKTSLKKCVRGLPASLLPLALEARYPAIRTHSCLDLNNIDALWADEDKSRVLQAAATFTCIDHLELNAAWTEACRGPVESSTRNLLNALSPNLKVLHIHGAGAAKRLLSSVSTLTNLQSFVLKRDHPTSLYPDAVTLQKCLLALSALPELRCLVMRNVHVDPQDHSLKSWSTWDAHSRFSRLTELELCCRSLHHNSLNLGLSNILSCPLDLKSLHLASYCHRLDMVSSFPYQPDTLLQIAQAQHLTALTLGRIYYYHPATATKVGYGEVLKQQTAASFALAATLLGGIVFSLQYLDLDGHCVTSDVFDAISTAICSMSELRTLKMAQFSERTDYIWWRLSQDAQDLPKLQTLQLLHVCLSPDSRERIGAALLHLPNLQELCLDMCGMKFVSKKLWEGIQQLRSLVYLSLCNNSLPVEEAEQLAVCCLTMNLTRLDLCRTFEHKHTADTAKVLLRCIRSMPSLRVLSLLRKDMNSDALKLLEKETLRSGAAEQFSESIVCWDVYPVHLSVRQGQSYQFYRTP